MKTENKHNEFRFRFTEEMESFLREQLKEGCSIAEVSITVKGLDFTATQKLTKKESIDEWLKNIFRT